MLGLGRGMHSSSALVPRWHSSVGTKYIYTIDVKTVKVSVQNHIQEMSLFFQPDSVTFFPIYSFNELLWEVTKLYCYGL